MYIQFTFNLIDIYFTIYSIHIHTYIWGLYIYTIRFHVSIEIPFSIETCQASILHKYFVSCVCVHV